MSQENVEMLHGIYELLNTRFAALKGGDMDDLLAFFDPEVVIETVDAPDPETYHGHDGVRSWFNDLYGPWAAVHIEAEDIKVSGQWTVALLHVSLRGEASGVELELPIAAFHQFRGGKIVRDRIYLDRDEALETFALKEWPMAEENVEVVRAVFETWNAPDMDAWRDLHHSDVIMRNPEGWPEPGPFVGLDAVMRNFEEAREVWDTDTIEPVSDFVTAADRVLVRTIWRGVGRGPESSMEFTMIFTVRKRRVAQIEFSWDHAEALESVGLSG